jgi:Uma2 family endonuclease
MGESSQTVMEALQEPAPVKPAKEIAPSDPWDLVSEFAPLPPELWPDVDHLITEDDTPLDNIGSEKQQRLSASSLYGWRGPRDGRPFVVMANVGLFYSVHAPALVPDLMLSIGVSLPQDVWKKSKRSYMVWEYGKPPDLVLEIVSNLVGGEDDSKMAKYAEIGVKYYVIYDPQQLLSNEPLRIYELHPTGYELMDSTWMPAIELGLTLWHGRFEDRVDTWLRWCDEHGNLLPTGEERAEQERQRAEQEHQRAEQERQRAEQEQQRAEQERQRAEQERMEKEAAQQELERLRALLVKPGEQAELDSPPQDPKEKP